MRPWIVCILAAVLLVAGCSTEEKKVDNAELQQLADADQQDRVTESDEPIAPRDDKRRMRVFQLLAEGAVKTPQDKFNAALILQHTGFIFVGEEMKSKSVENYYLAHLLAKEALEQGLEEARQYVAMFYDRYLWMTEGYQKYGTQSVYIDGQAYWVTIDLLTTDAERAVYEIKPLAELLERRPMQPLAGK